MVPAGELPAVTRLVSYAYLIVLTIFETGRLMAANPAPVIPLLKRGNTSPVARSGPTLVTVSVPPLTVMAPTADTSEQLDELVRLSCMFSTPSRVAALVTLNTPGVKLLMVVAASKRLPMLVPPLFT